MYKIDDFDVQALAEAGSTFEPLWAPDKPMGIKITVYGSEHAGINAKIDKLSRELELSLDIIKANDSPEAEKEKQITQARMKFMEEAAALRIKSWEGFEDDCTYELALKLCRKNPYIVMQVLDRSKKIENFTKA
jgi:CO dehydrogenase/acetyl-CoA synthase epsilon subunit